MEAIRLAKVSGDTNAVNALDSISDVFRNNGRQGVRKVLIWLSDGRLEKDHVATLRTATKVREEVEIFVVGVGNNLNIMNLNGIASMPLDSHRWDIRRKEDIDSQVNALLDEICF